MSFADLISRRHLVQFIEIKSFSRLICQLSDEMSANNGPNRLIVLLL